MTVVEIAGLRFGEGMPKICVPLIGRGSPALLHEALSVRDLPADLFEWRADFFFGGFERGMRALHESRLGKPLLCTLRTEREGGQAALLPEEYEAKLTRLLDVGGFELLDIELSCGEERVTRLVEKAKAKGIGVVLSSHDFLDTPPEEEIYQTLVRMHRLGGDLPKVAVTPREPRDVLALLAATLRAHDAFGPVITMAMGEMGKLTRVSGQVFGSCVTFGAGAGASAPGQINAEDLRAILEDLAPV